VRSFWNNAMFSKRDIKLMLPKMSCGNMVILHITMYLWGPDMSGRMIRYTCYWGHCCGVRTRKWRTSDSNNCEFMITTRSPFKCGLRRLVNVICLWEQSTLCVWQWFRALVSSRFGYRNNKTNERCTTTARSRSSRKRNHHRDDVKELANKWRSVCEGM
jgi:hypothetical protein